MPGARELLKSSKGAIESNMGLGKIILTEMWWHIDGGQVCQRDRKA